MGDVIIDGLLKRAAERLDKSTQLIQQVRLFFSRSFPDPYHPSRPLDATALGVNLETNAGAP